MPQICKVLKAVTGLSTVPLIKLLFAFWMQSLASSAPGAHDGLIAKNDSDRLVVCDGQVVHLTLTDCRPAKSVKLELSLADPCSKSQH